MMTDQVNRRTQIIIHDMSIIICFVECHADGRILQGRHTAFVRSQSSAKRQPSHAALQPQRKLRINRQIPHPGACPAPGQCPVPRELCRPIRVRPRANVLQSNILFIHIAIRIHHVQLSKERLLLRARRSNESKLRISLRSGTRTASGAIDLSSLFRLERMQLSHRSLGESMVVRAHFNEGLDHR